MDAGRSWNRNDPPSGCAGSTGGIPNDDGIPENWQLQLENFDTFLPF